MNEQELAALARKMIAELGNSISSHISVMNDFLTKPTSKSSQSLADEFRHNAETLCYFAIESGIADQLTFWKSTQKDARAMVRRLTKINNEVNSREAAHL